jgi:hypothetical protein
VWQFAFKLKTSFLIYAIIDPPFYLLLFFTTTALANKVANKVANKEPFNRK